MIFRSHKLNGRSILGKAVSDDGFNFNVESKPFMVPETKGVFKEYEAFGGEYLITYSAYSKFGQYGYHIRPI